VPDFSIAIHWKDDQVVGLKLIEVEVEVGFFIQRMSLCIFASLTVFEMGDVELVVDASGSLDVSCTVVSTMAQLRLVEDLLATQLINLHRL